MSSRMNWKRARPFREITDIGAEERTSHRRKGRRAPSRDWGSMIADFGRDLRGLGGLQTAAIRAPKGSTFGAANVGRRLSPQEQKEIEDRLRLAGQLNLAPAR